MKVYDIISEATINTPKLTQLPDGKWTWALPPEGATKMGSFPSREIAIKWARENPDKFPPRPPAPTPPKPGDAPTTDKPPTDKPPTDKPPTDKPPTDKPTDKPKPGPTDKPGKERPSETVKKKLKPKEIVRWQQKVAEKAALLQSSTIYRIVGKIANWAPWFEFIDDMEAIQILYDSGAYGVKGNNEAMAIAESLRGEAGTILISKLVTQNGLLFVLARASGPMLRGLAGLLGTLPAAGWIAGASVFVASIAIPYILQQEEVQKWILQTMIGTVLQYPGRLIGNIGGRGQSALSIAFNGYTQTSPIPQDWKEINLEAKEEVRKVIGSKPNDTLDSQRAAQKKKAERGIVPTPTPDADPKSDAAPADTTAQPSTPRQVQTGPGTSLDDLLKQLN